MWRHWKQCIATQHSINWLKSVRIWQQGTSGNYCCHSLTTNFQTHRDLSLSHAMHIPNPPTWFGGKVAYFMEENTINCIWYAPQAEYYFTLHIQVAAQLHTCCVWHLCTICDPSPCAAWAHKCPHSYRAQVVNCSLAEQICSSVHAYLSEN